ncbi:MAG: sulfonate ABC transporter ATP-binding protein [Deltaproteobacteria bacterium RIFCSPLOWO2_12_FULL_60_16]|nr:MAG: sulfonate ABC transporter ATP-binding protein [Deltaproteobacteria bacterium RIFCSPLOWO2_12_FULL_60_16]
MEYYQPRTGGRLLALDNVNLAVEEGEFVTIVGPSGCGKTTFINIADGLLKPTGGKIMLDGIEVKGPGLDRAMVFQDPCLLPWRTVLKNVLFGMECQGRDGAKEKDRALKFIKLVGLSGFEDHYPHELSGGMQQRCNLARALTVDPEILIMDEPFAALDAQTREIMQMELLRIWNEARKTVLFITHQINEAIYLADRVIIFGARPGRVKDVLKIDIPRPRKLSVKREKQFLEYEDHLWNQIEEEVKKTMVQDQVVHNIDA